MVATAAVAARPFPAPDLTIINSGAIGTGNPGSGGILGFGGAGFDPGANGAFGSAGGLQIVSIAFTGGENSLTLEAGSSIGGQVVAVSGGSDALRLGGSANEAFDVSTIGVQYRNFATFEKTGGSIWTLTGTPTPAPRRRGRSPRARWRSPRATTWARAARR